MHRRAALLWLGLVKNMVPVVFVLLLKRNLESK